MNELHLFAVMKTCSKCKIEKPKSDFYRNKSQSDRLSYYCKDCAKDEQRRIYSSNPEKYRLKTIAYRSKFGPIYSKLRKENRREIHITESARKYKTSKELIIEVLKKDKCEICGESVSFDNPKLHLRPNIDHCHKTMKLRGLLCGYCNNLLGRANDDISVLEKAIKYLNERK